MSTAPADRGAGGGDAAPPLVAVAGGADRGGVEGAPLDGGGFAGFGERVRELMVVCRCG